ncbi:hypothetical protein LCGC14_1706350, partial [marine sediment metagenome]
MYYLNATQAYLSDSEKRYKILIENIKDCLYEFESDGTLTYVSPQIYDILGYKPEEMIGENQYDYIHKKDLTKFLNSINKVSKTSGNATNEFKMLHKNGSYIDVSTKGNFIKINGSMNFVGILSDISERKEEERLLTESERKFRLLYKNAPLPYQSLDENGCILEVNRAWLNFFGYKKEEVIGKWLGDFMVPSGQDFFKVKFPQFKEEGSVQNIQYVIIRKDGEHRIISFNGAIVYDENGNFERTHCIFQDITERKRDAQRIRDSEEKFRILAEQSLMGIGIVKDNKLIYVNKAYSDMFGYTIEEMRSWVLKNTVNAIHPDDRDFVIKQLEKKKKGDSDIVVHYEYRGIKKSGDIIWVDQYSKSIIYEGKSAIFITLVDISERKKAEEKLKKSEEKYRLLFENMNEGFALCKIITDENNIPVDFLYLEINETFERLTGLKKEETVGKRVTEVIPGIDDSEPNLFEIYGKVALTGENTKFEIFFEPLKIWLSISVYSPKKNYFVAVFDNITERKKAEQELKESEEKFRMIFNNANDAIVIVDLEGKILECNQTTSDRLGYTKEELLLMSPVDFDTPQYAEGVLDRIEKVRQKGELSYEVEHLRKDGLVILTEVNSKLIDFQGKPTILSIARDITIRKKAEEKLISSEKKVQNLINNISDVLIEVNVDGVFTFTSPQIFRLIESRSEQIINSKLIVLLHQEDRDSYQESFKAALNSKAPLFLECKIRHKKGYYIPISIRGSFVEINNVNKFFGVIRDITERKQIENMIKKEIKTLKDLDKIRNNLVTRMSHELKTPLIS